MKKLILSGLALALSLSAVGCGGGGGGGASYDPYYHAWYDVYGVYCYSGYPSPGCNFFSNGIKADYSNDPSTAPLQYGTYQYTDSYGYGQYFTGWARLTSAGLLYDQNGYALNEEGQTDGRDLLGDVAAAEKAQVTTAGKGLAEKHALAEVTGIKIAETLNDWATLGKKHGRTQRDIEDFSGRLFGVTAEQVKPALTAAAHGDVSGLEAINNDVATHWNTNPETSKEILKVWYQSEVSQFQASH